MIKLEFNFIVYTSTSQYLHFTDIRSCFPLRKNTYVACNF